MAKMNFTGVDPFGRPLGFTESLDTFQEASYVKSSADDIFKDEELTIDTPVKGDPEPADTPCPDPALPAPPPCHRYEQYFIEGDKCPQYRLVLEEGCQEEADTAEPKDQGTKFPDWASLSCDQILAEVNAIKEYLMAARLTEAAYMQYQQQLDIANALIQKKCTKDMEPTYTMLNWKSIPCDMIPSAINDLKYMVAQGGVSDVDLEMMKKDAMIGEDFYKTNCAATDGGGLVTVDDLLNGGGIIPPKDVVFTPPVDVQPKETQLVAPENVDVVEQGPAKKNYIWLYIAAAATAFYLLTRSK